MGDENNPSVYLGILLILFRENWQDTKSDYMPGRAS